MVTENVHYVENAKQRLKGSLLYIGVFFGTLVIVVGPIGNPTLGLGICTAVTLAVYGVRRFLQSGHATRR
jgi:hypothetical protein